MPPKRVVIAVLVFAVVLLMALGAGGVYWLAMPRPVPAPVPVLRTDAAPVAKRLGFVKTISQCRWIGGALGAPPGRFDVPGPTDYYLKGFAEVDAATWQKLLATPGLAAAGKPSVAFGLDGVAVGALHFKRLPDDAAEPMLSSGGYAGEIWVGAEKPVIWFDIASR